MRTARAAAVGMVLGLVAAGAARADDAAEARKLVDQAIAAQGGKELLAKYDSTTSKMKGTVHTQGMDLEFTADSATAGADRHKLTVRFEVMGQAFTFTRVLNKDKGWTKINDMLTDLDADKLKEALEEAHAGWVAGLVPLTGPGFTLTTTGETKVDDKQALGVKVSYKGKRDVTLYFDAKTHLLVKSESRVVDDGGQEVTEETFPSGYAGDGAKQAMKLVIKRDSKPFLEGEITEIKPVEKHEDSTFDKP